MITVKPDGTHLEDIAMVCGATFISKDSGIRLKDVKLKDLVSQLKELRLVNTSLLSPMVPQIMIRWTKA